MDRRHVSIALCAIFAVAPRVAAASPASSTTAARAAVGIATGVVARGLGRGAFTLGGVGSYRFKLGFLPLVLRGSVAGTGFVGGEPGFFARGELAFGGAVLEELWLDAGAGVDVLTFRTCGALNCGRINGAVPAASARLVWFNGWFDRAVGLSFEVGAFYVMRSDVQEGLTFTASAGPLWRFGGM